MSENNHQDAKPQIGIDKKKVLKPYQKKHITNICAIDFGSFGFAAAWCPKDIPDHEHVVRNSHADISKNLAALLIDKETEEVVDFGYEAEKKYAKSQENKDKNPNEKTKYMYYQHFKPHLYKKLESSDEKGIKYVCNTIM